MVNSFIDSENVENKTAEQKKEERQPFKPISLSKPKELDCQVSQSKQNGHQHGDYNMLTFHQHVHLQNMRRNQVNEESENDGIEKIQVQRKNEPTSTSVYTPMKGGLKEKIKAGKENNGVEGVLTDRQIGCPEHSSKSIANEN